MCFNEWLDVLRTAIQAVGKDYYSDYPSEWIAENADERAREYWKATLAQYNERDWCYELYHQLRIALDSKRLPCGVRLSGESSKSATYEAIDQGTRWSQNTRCRIPDILLHDPLTCDNQIMAIEVKRCGFGRNPVASWEVKEDLIALFEYVQGLHFQLGVFIGVGIESGVASEAIKSLSACGGFRDAANKICVCLAPNEPSDDINFTIASRML